MRPLIPPFDVVKFPIPSADDPLITIHGFGILVALGFVFGGRMAMRKAARDGLDGTVVNQLITLLVVGVLVGGHLGHALFYEPAEHFADPIKFLYVWQGLSSFGGFIACTVLVVLFVRNANKKTRLENASRKERGEALEPTLPFWGYADVLVYGFTLGWFFGRMGCFVAHDHRGTQTQFWLGVPNWPGQPPQYAFHDLGLYEALWSLAMTFVVIALDRKPRFPGFFVSLVIMAYGPFRFFLDVLRQDDTRYYALTPAQYGSVLLTLVGVGVYMRQRGKPPIRVETPAPAPAPAPA
jgi:phosphatidylglycerol:prolipoprotein diacylglycerol transferase